MSSDIITNFELDKLNSSCKIIIIKEISGCDSSFISSSVYGYCIKNKIPLLIISLHNSLLHYHNAGLKMNYNLQKSIDSGLIDFYDGGEDLVSRILENKAYSQHNLWNTLKAKITKLYEQYGAVHVVCEGISHLLDMQFSFKEVNELCTNIIELIRSYNNSFLIFHCNVANDDDITNILANNLTHKAHILTEVENLPSGLSADVSGRLTFKYLSYKYQSEHLHTLHQKKTQYLFKLFDRGVKLLAPGTV